MTALPIELGDYENNAKEAIKTFWGNRQAAIRGQEETGRTDRGNRAAVTAGKNLDGFVSLIAKVVNANGLVDVLYTTGRARRTLPGYFRATKNWDLLVVHESTLIAAIEFKSHVGSFGNNFNNRVEEAIGNAVDLRTAYRDGAFGSAVAEPFIGYLMVLEDAVGSRRSVSVKSPHFPIFSEFENASYAERYRLLCRKLVHERLYTAAALLMSHQDGSGTGEYTEADEQTGLKNFVTLLAAHVSAEAVRSGA